MTATFASRHIGPSENDVHAMLQELNAESLESFVNEAVPTTVRTKKTPNLPLAGLSEQAALARIRELATQNKVFRSFIGCGYYGTLTPTVIQRNILENPGWYTAYTPYQPEIAQGRLEAILNFQTVVTNLTGLPVANGSLLDEGTAAAEAVSVCHAAATHLEDSPPSLFLAHDIFPQTKAVVRTRAEAVGIKIIEGNVDTLDPESQPGLFAIIVQYPGDRGVVRDFSRLTTSAQQKQIRIICCTDLLALTMLKPPGEWGADIAVGNAQRFGVPLGFGGPHAAFFAVKDELKRLMPGRLVGISKDSAGNQALRLSLQTREQHIRRERATSNICTSQVLLAVMSGMYAVYHGPRGLLNIAEEIHRKTQVLAATILDRGFTLATGESTAFFDTLSIVVPAAAQETVKERAKEKSINLRYFTDGTIGISIDETTTDDELQSLAYIFCGAGVLLNVDAHGKNSTNGGKLQRESAIPKVLQRTSSYLEQAVFNSYHTESEFLRYVHRLENKDIALNDSMIPLGSCTMKLNATSEMLPVSWPEFSSLHPFVPADQSKGYRKLFADLENALATVTGFAGVSLQPNAGSQGEYAGLLVIRAFQKSMGEGHRNVCLIPKSAHGTNPASAVMAGLHVVVVECDVEGNVDFSDLKQKAEQYRDTLSSLMVTYPSTHGVFEEQISEIASYIHKCGGQVYLDGANLNALVGLVTPQEVGADVCHINLHKTFCIPHGGGGPGMGPIGVASHLVPFLPGHPISDTGGEKAIGSVSAGGWGSASILPISWMYITMMGAEGLKRASQIAILNANYIAKKLAPSYPVVFTRKNGYVAHECIIDLRPLKKFGIEVEDVAKRLMDYGFHAPTVSWPVSGTMMIEPTESESKGEIDRFCDAMISIRAEIAAIERGEFPRDINVLKGAPHTAEVLLSDKWDRPYSRELAAFPTQSVRNAKVWPAVGRIDAAYGDRNLVCTCDSIESYR